MFDPHEHLTQLKGKDYLEVKWRLVWFRDEYGALGWIETELEQLDRDKGFALFRAEVGCLNEHNTNLDLGQQILMATAHGSETRGDFGDYIEKAETKAVGRALAMAGFGTQFTEEESELDGLRGERIVDAPVAAKGRGRPRKAPSVTPAGKASIAAPKSPPAKGPALRQQLNALLTGLGERGVLSQEQAAQEVQERYNTTPDKLTDEQRAAYRDVLEERAKEHGLEIPNGR